MYSIDIEDALRLAITCQELPASAPPFPPSFTVPFCMVKAVGGDTHDLVIDRLAVTILVYAETWAQAQELAQLAMARVRATEGTWIGTEVRGRSFVYYVEIDALPFNDPDPERNDLARWSFNASIHIRNID